MPVLQRAERKHATQSGARPKDPTAKSATREGAESLGQWLMAVQSMRGESDAMSVDAAVALIRATPPDRRSEFAQQIWARRRKHFPKSGRSRSSSDKEPS